MVLRGVNGVGVVEDGSVGRLGIEDALRVSPNVERLEADQNLQDAVLTAYHLMTILFEQTYNTKVIWSDSGRWWTRSWKRAA